MYKQLMKVSLGFRLVYIGMLLIVIGILGGMLGLCLGAGIAGGGGFKAGAGIMLVATGIMMLLLLGGSILGFVGRIFCFAVPERAGSAKPMIMISVMLEIAAFGLSLVGGIMNFTGNARQASRWGSTAPKSSAPSPRPSCSCFSPKPWPSSSTATTSRKPP